MNRIVEGISAKSSSDTKSNASHSNIETISFGQANQAYHDNTPEDKTDPDHVTSAQKLFKRYGRRLDVFKAIKVDLEEQDDSNDSGNEQKGLKKAGKKTEKTLKTVKM